MSPVGSALLPLDALTSEVACSLEGVVFDVDDTITRDGVVEAEAYGALFRLRDAGLLRIAVTGRPLGWAEVIATIWPIDLAIGENGAGWFARSGKLVRGGLFDEASQPEHMRALDVVTAALRDQIPELAPSRDSTLRRCDRAFDVGELVTVPRERVHRAREIIEAHGLHAVVSSVHLHAIPGPWDKGSGVLRAAREMLAIPPARARERLLFVGDSGNDAAAFSTFANTVGVANVRAHLDSLPVPPRLITTLDRGRGFAELVELLLERRGAR